MCKQNYVNLISVSEQSGSVISICCVFCKNGIPYKGQLTFPICEATAHKARIRRKSVRRASALYQLKRTRTRARKAAERR